MLPLIADLSADTVIARKGEKLITQAQFLGQARVLAQRLPTGGHAINLCEDRYAFGFAFWQNHAVLDALNRPLADATSGALQHPRGALPRHEGGAGRARATRTRSE